MTRKKLVISLALILLFSFSLVSQGFDNESMSSGQRFQLFDANGQRLGSLLDASPYDDQMYRAYLPEQDVIIQVLDQIQQQTLQLRDRGIANGIYFEQSGCTGNAFTRISHAGVHGIIRMPIGSSVRYFKGTADAGGIQTTISYFDGTKCLNTNPQTTTHFLIQEISLPFSEPLAWPLKIH